ncbi:nicotinate phosphoribosyltransferase [Shimazuella alba]|uniref:Nicotinate phosphoribosyltransferase n=1 Tax=Shimazuella alba TaxID=2690964 RepID=A0A6I4W016_9BACL|nr:nicotinate phosphoribosyltransferase [Shimazuella alba]MXQ55545.1 nicotinate phosphoribosyltransferase [Shimazuella alba]
MSISLHTDKYQLTMMYAHWKNGTHTHRRSFELFFRSLPFGNGYAVFAGLTRALDYLENLHFNEEDLAYLRENCPGFEATFFDYLRQFRFQADVDALAEGTLIFPDEPLLRLDGTIFELHLVETALLNFIGYQTLVATKAARIRHIAPEDTLLEFGSRRAQEQDAAIWGARATYLAGFDATSNMLAGQQFSIPTSGTHAHAWVQDFPCELEAFRAYAHAFPDSSVLLVDTYDTLKSGVPNAIQVGKELKAKGHQLVGIRLDSGDLAFLSKQARTMLDEAGLTETKIIASSDLDEETILNLKQQGAQIDGWGVGTKLITAYDQPALGAVYKMVAKENDSTWEPTIKISSNPAKISTPGRKTIFRIIDRETGKARGDWIASYEQLLKEEEPLTLFHPEHPYKQKVVTNFLAIPLLQPLLRNGKLIAKLPTLLESRQYHQKQLQLFWDEQLRILNPEEYHVDLSKQLWEQKQKMIQDIYKEVHR